MQDIYIDGTYRDKNADWHVEDSPWKARQIRKILDRNSLQPKTICEIGCGAGQILNDLSQNMEDVEHFYGFEISPQAFELCGPLAKQNLSFELTDLLATTNLYDLVMAIDVFEHVEDYIGFIRSLRTKGQYQLFHIPLDLSVQSVLRGTPMRSREEVGHLHYFYKDTALATLDDAGCDVIDWFYTASDLELPNRGWKANLAKLPRKMLYAINQDWAARCLGGFSLMVLTK